MHLCITNGKLGLHPFIEPSQLAFTLHPVDPAGIPRPDTGIVREQFLQAVEWDLNKRQFASRDAYVQEMDILSNLLTPSVLVDVEDREADIARIRQGEGLRYLDNSQRKQIIAWVIESQDERHTADMPAATETVATTSVSSPSLDNSVTAIPERTGGAISQLASSGRARPESDLYGDQLSVRATTPQSDRRGSTEALITTGASTASAFTATASASEFRSGIRTSQPNPRSIR